MTGSPFCHPPVLVGVKALLESGKPLFAGKPLFEGVKPLCGCGKVLFWGGKPLFEGGKADGAPKQYKYSYLIETNYYIV